MTPKPSILVVRNLHGFLDKLRYNSHGNNELHVLGSTQCLNDAVLVRVGFQQYHIAIWMSNQQFFVLRPHSETFTFTRCERAVGVRVYVHVL